MGEVKQLVGYGIFQPTLGSDKSFDGEWSVLTAGEALSFGEACYLKSDGKVWKSDANSASTMPAIFLCIQKSGISANSTGNFLLRGWVRNDAWDWTVGGIIYAQASADPAGQLTQTAPSGAGDQVQVCGIGGITADYIYWDPDKTLVEIEGGA